MDTVDALLNGARANAMEKRTSEGSPDLVGDEPTVKRRKLEEEVENGEHRLADPSSIPDSVAAPSDSGVDIHGEDHDGHSSDEESGDYSFDEMMAMQDIPGEKRGDNFEAFVAHCKTEGKHELELLGELGFKYLVSHLETNEDAAQLIERAIQGAKEAKLELERQAAEKLVQGIDAPVVEQPQESEKPAEPAAEASEKLKTGSLLQAFLDDDMDDLDDLDDSDDGSYDPTAAVFDAGDSDSEDGILLTDPIEILGVISSHIRHSEDHLPPRRRLTDITGEDDVIKLIESAKKIIVLSGAGISVACGVPDFRSAGGLYDQIKEKYNLTDPQLLFDINYIRKDQVPFYDFAAQLFPSTDLKPSKAHKFIKLLQDKGKLLRNYSQNIDTLEQQVGIKEENLILCHGSFATFSCPIGHRVDGSVIKPKLDSKHIPQCEVCNDPTGKMFLKPDIVFFGEALPDSFRAHIRQDVKEADLLIVMGSSLRVQPVALVPRTYFSEKKTPKKNSNVFC
jgi:NAD-dependent SIR2 family protein deacetylase